MWLPQSTWDLFKEQLSELKTALRASDVDVRELEIKFTDASARAQALEQRIRDERAQAAVALEQEKAHHAITRNNFEWMRVQFNAASLDRAMLAEQKGIRLPAPQIDNETGAGTAARPLQPGQAVDDAEPPPFSPPASNENPEDWMENMNGVVGDFQDVGDQAAGKMGAAHDKDGNVEWGRPRSADES